MAYGREDRWGYEILVRDDATWSNRVSGWSEGDPLIEEKVAKAGVRQAVKYALTSLSGAPGSVVSVSGAVGDAIGTPIGLLIKKGVIDVLTHAAEIRLATTYIDGNSGVDVQIRGDYELDYRIEAFGDLRALPALLAVTPAAFGTDSDPYFMRRAVVESCYLQQLKYLRKGMFASRKRAKLMIDIDI